ncbi:MAG: hypothetical protein IT278_06000 [Ignavibacteriaceae bacterium]|jgi:hypothetical protein|nr:hypothetical protein [Ignavibacteriaceae bacterium]
MKFISKYRRYSITIHGKKYAFVPEEATGTFTTNNEEEIGVLTTSPAFGRDFYKSEEPIGEGTGEEAKQKGKRK